MESRSKLWNLFIQMIAADRANCAVSNPELSIYIDGG